MNEMVNYCKNTDLTVITSQVVNLHINDFLDPRKSFQRPNFTEDNNKRQQWIIYKSIIPVVPS